MLPCFRFAKYFGSGVIIATAFIHLLAPAFEELGSECLSGAWTDYDWAPAIAMAAVYGIFFAEVAAYRIGTKKLMSLGVNYSMCPFQLVLLRSVPRLTKAQTLITMPRPTLMPTTTATTRPSTSKTALQPKARSSRRPDRAKRSDTPISKPRETTTTSTSSHREPRLPLNSSVLPFSSLVLSCTGRSRLHWPRKLLLTCACSVIIGLTLAVNEDFVTLFIVIIFHRKSTVPHALRGHS